MVVGPGGLEPPTSRLSGVCSNQLSYRPETITPHPSRKRRPMRRAGRRYGGGGATVPKNGQAGRNVFERSRSPRERALSRILRKEVIQPQVPLRLPCYDFTPVADPTVVACPLAVGATPSGRTNSHGVTGGVYKARERIHRGMLIRDY